MALNRAEKAYVEGHGHYGTFWDIRIKNVECRMQKGGGTGRAGKNRPIYIRPLAAQCVERGECLVCPVGCGMENAVSRVGTGG